MSDSDDYNEAETTKRRDKALSRALNTPPKPKEGKREPGKPSPRPNSPQKDRKDRRNSKQN